MLDTDGESKVKKTFKIEFSKRVPIVEAEGAKWLVDTGCPFSGIYTLIDYQAGTITCSDEPISFEGTSVPLMMGTGSRPYVRMSVGGKEVEAYLDTGAAISYLRGLDRTKWPSAGEKDECNQNGDRWSTDTVVVPASIEGLPFEVEFGDEQKNTMFQMAVDKDAVIGYDFFKSFTVLLNRREMRLTFKPAGK